MGAVWLLSLPDVIRAAGLDVDVYPGWQTRSRSTGGYDKVLGVQVHHTASKATPQSDMRYMWEGSPDRPIGAIYLARSGKVTVGAAGATNTSGRGGPLGMIPLDSANRYVISIEAANLGNGEPWPETQQLAYLKLVNALVNAYGLSFTVPGVHAHFEWTIRKIDPAGESRWATGTNKWNMNAFRQAAAFTPPVVPPVEPPVVPPTTPSLGVPDVFIPITPFRNSDTRAYGGYGLPAGVNHSFGLNTSVFPANVSAVAMNFVVINPSSDGQITIWNNGSRPEASCGNFKSGPGATSGSIIVGVDGLSGFDVYLSAVAHLIVDITGYWTP